MAKRAAKKKTRRRRGRPTEYKSRYCQMLINFFDVSPYHIVEIPHYDKLGRVYESGRNKGKPVVTWIEHKKVANDAPTLRKFAKKIGMHIATVYRWIDENSDTFQQEFCDAFTCARALKKDFLQENGLRGLHNPLYAKFVAINETDMTDTSKHEVSGPEGGPLPPIQVNVLPK